MTDQGRDTRMAQQHGKPERRGFLRALGIGLAAPAVAQAVEYRADQVPAAQARKENEPQRIAARYRESEHVKAFYRTNRYEQ